MDKLALLGRIHSNGTPHPSTEEGEESKALVRGFNARKLSGKSLHVPPSEERLELAKTDGKKGFDRVTAFSSHSAVPIN